MIPVSIPVLAFLEINAKGGEEQSFMLKGRYMLMQRGRYDQGGEPISIFILT
jgi:hypothetical protein